jgi:thiamine-phosphate pyrophosphorylase
VDIIQLRDKTVDAGAELELLFLLGRVAGEHGKLWAVNDRADLAALSGAPVLHVGQTDIPVDAARRLLPAAALGLSSHSRDQALAASAPDGPDYFCVGPLWATPTKPGRAAVGLSLVNYAASLPGSKPWFAIGGIDHSNLRQVVAAGARRVVVVRAITDAADPAEAARALLAALPPLSPAA